MNETRFVQAHGRLCTAHVIKLAPDLLLELNINNAYYLKQKPGEKIIITGNVDIKTTTVYLQTTVSCLHHKALSLLVCFLFLVKKQFILPLCSSSKITWNSYGPLQMISAYFPARGRSLNRVKKQSSFVEFEQARNGL